MSSVRVLLLAQTGEACDRYKHELDDLGVEYDVVETLEDMEEALTHRSYNGILTDVVARTKGDAITKRRVHYVLETDMFPVMRLKWNPQKEIIHTLSNRHYQGEETMASFIESHCRVFRGRPIRADERFPLHFNLTVMKSDLSSHPEQSVTVDVSKGGCYICSYQRWRVEEKANFIVMELRNQTPITGEVRWHISWGKAMKFPGFGVRFVDIGEDQLSDLLCYSKNQKY